MIKQKSETPKGIINAAFFKDSFDFQLFHPSDHLKHYIEHYWLISWQLPDGTSHSQEVIPHPCNHLTFLAGDSKIKGVQTQKYTHKLSGSGNIIGTKFRPAGFYPLAQNLGLKMPDMPNNVFEINQFFDVDTNGFESDILKLKNPADKIHKLETELYNHLPKLDDNVPKINQIVAQIETDKTILKVSDICQKFDLEERQLQRLFSKYIGVSAKWIINRYRIHEALEQIEAADQINWSDLAVKLGYYDQAHFIKDFKNLIGTAPDGYLKNLK